MDYLSSFDISASGMAVEKLRMDLISLNLANAHTTRTASGGAYKPLTLVTRPDEHMVFSAELAKAYGVQMPAGVKVEQIVPMDVPEKLAFEPEHPDADEKGFVHYPGVNTASEMMNMIKATRAYEANIKALSAARSMAQKALQIGR